MNSPATSKQWAAFARALEVGSRSLLLRTQAESLVQALGAVLPAGHLQCTLEDGPAEGTASSEVRPASTDESMEKNLSPDAEFKVRVVWSGVSTDRAAVEAVLSEADLTLRPVLVAWSTMRREAVLDPLTRTRNRRALGEHLDVQFALFRRHEIPCSALMVDIDGFKQINDIRGHLAGDQALSDLADWIRTATRAEDRLFRYGGDEFALILPATDETGARGLAVRLKAEDCPLRISVGVATWTADDSAEDLLTRADADLLASRANPDA